MSKYIAGTLRALAGVALAALVILLLAVRVLFGLSVYVIAIGGAYLIYMELF